MIIEELCMMIKYQNSILESYIYIIYIFFSINFYHNLSCDHYITTLILQGQHWWSLLRQMFTIPGSVLPPVLLRHLLFEQGERKEWGENGDSNFQNPSHNGSMYGRLMTTKLGFLLMVNVTINIYIYKYGIRIRILWASYSEYLCCFSWPSTWVLNVFCLLRLWGPNCHSSSRALGRRFPKMGRWIFNEDNHPFEICGGTSILGNLPF